MTDQRMLNLVLKWWDLLQSTQKQTGHLREKQLDSHKMRKNKRAKRLKEASDMSDGVARGVLFGEVHGQCSQQKRHQSKINGQKSILMFPGSKTLL